MEFKVLHCFFCKFFYHKKISNLRTILSKTEQKFENGDGSLCIHDGRLIGFICMKSYCLEL